MAELLLGIDGGGSKTRALIADREGKVLGVGSAGSSNYQAVGFDEATRGLHQAIAGALESAGLSPETPFAAACFGLAGAGRPADHARFSAWVVEQRLAPRHRIVNDAELLLAAGTPGGWGIALIGGTGSICYGSAPDGRTARAGGWGYLLGDEGSGYAIALDALRLATQTADGRAEAHALLQAILRHWALDEPSRFIPYVYRPTVTRADIAALARPLIDLAAAGNPDAARIVDGAAHELARLVAAVARRLDLHEPPLALGGGLLGASDSLRQAVVERAQIALGPVRYVDDPAAGAIVLARRLLDV